MVYTVYCTTCLVTKRYYIGVHKTAVPDDRYLGSGKYLGYAIKKYGEANFQKEVLFVYDSPEEAFAKEALLIRCHRRNKSCMNLRSGGAGGFDYLNSTGLGRIGAVRGAATGAGAAGMRRRLAVDPALRAKITAACRASLKCQLHWKKWQESGSVKWTGQHHSLDAKISLSVSHRGTNNPQYGTKWITDGMASTRIKYDCAVPLGWHAGRVQKAKPIPKFLAR
jgi:hypothetical protein